MMTLLKHIWPAVILVLAGFNSAHAVLLDFTDPNVNSGTVVSGSILGTTYNVTGNPFTPNRNENFDGNSNCPVSSGLYCRLSNPTPEATDGFGISNDEITGGDPSQALTITFGTALKVTRIHLLDLYEGLNKEEASVTFYNGATLLGTETILAQVLLSNSEHGYATKAVDYNADRVVLSGRDFFGDDGSNDFSFAGMNVAAVPVPAAAWLFGSALIGLAGLGRRRRA